MKLSLTILLTLIIGFSATAVRCSTGYSDWSLSYNGLIWKPNISQYQLALRSDIYHRHANQTYLSQREIGLSLINGKTQGAYLKLACIQPKFYWRIDGFVELYPSLGLESGFFNHPSKTEASQEIAGYYLSPFLQLQTRIAFPYIGIIRASISSSYLQGLQGFAKENQGFQFYFSLALGLNTRNLKSRIRAIQYHD